MATYGMFGSMAPRIRRLEPTQFDPLQYAPQMPTNPAPASAPVPRAGGAFGDWKATARRAQQGQAQAGQQPEGSKYTPGKRDWLGEIGADPLGFLLTGTNGLSANREEAMAYEASRAAKEAAALREAELMRLLTSGNANDRIKATALLNGEKLGESMASNYAAANMGAGDSRYLGMTGETITAPKFGVDGGYAYTQTPEGIAWGDQRGMSYGEETDAGTLAETRRSNMADEANARARLELDRTKPAGGDLTPYQQWQIQRAEEQDAIKAQERDATRATAVSNLQDGQQRVTDLMNHAGFAGIYGPFGALGVNMGAKPTNIMNQDELNAMALLDQVGGEAFLAGVQKMRGTGPLSDNEGKRVSAAVTRLTNRMQSPEAARAAAIEFNAAMRALEQAYAKESAARPQAGSGLSPDEESELEQLRREFNR